MPSRRRHRTHSTTPPAGSAGPTGSAGPAGSAALAGSADPAERFAAALRESEARDAARQAQEKAARAERDRKAAEAAAAQQALDDARAELERAIAAVRAARASGKGTVEADARWRVAKARVIELETGTAPAWAAGAAQPASSEATSAGTSGESPADST